MSLAEQVSIVLDWYDSDSIDAGQAEAIFKVLEQGQATADCKGIDNARKYIERTEKQIADRMIARGVQTEGQAA
jgi:hypothetical protein